MSKKPGQRIVSFDCMTLIWGVRRKGPPDMIRYAGYLFRELDECDAQIVLPSVVVAEFLIPARSEAERTRIVASLGERFQIAEFGARDAVTAAELWN